MLPCRSADEKRDSSARFNRGRFHFILAEIRSNDEGGMRNEKRAAFLVHHSAFRLLHFHQGAL
jgi:hypothetical protein